MNRRDVHRFDRLHQVRQVEEQRARQDLVAAHALLRNASQARDAARAAADQAPDIGIRELAIFRTELAVGQLRNEQLKAADDAVHLAEVAVVLAHNAWSAAARRVQGLDKLVERRREEARAEGLLAEAHESQELFLARRAMGQT
jgi:flagellar biosynthesis chaperone FliJ